jgi:arginyl-tRNA synthetase
MASEISGCAARRGFGTVQRVLHPGRTEMLAKISRNLQDSLCRTIREKYQLDYESISLTAPPRIAMGELATPVAFELARTVRRPPKELAEELAEVAKQAGGVRRAEVAGAGYLNFYLERAALARAMAEGLEQGDYGQGPPPYGGGKIIVEHTNINPNKAAHIGHLRNAALGDSFVRCLGMLGHTVEVQNYIDNTGVQVADVVVGLERMLGLTLAEVASLEGRFDYYCWDVYARVAEFYRGSEENLKWRSLTLRAIEAGGNPTAELAEHVAMRIVRAHLATMGRINVSYHLLPRESEILHLKFWEKAFELLKERRAVYRVDEGKNRGCWVMKTGERSEAEGIAGAGKAADEDEKIIIRSDGTVTYVGKDIAYQLWKFGLLGLDFRYRPFAPGFGPLLWITTAEADPAGVAPGFGGGRRVYNVIDTRQSYLQAIVAQGLRALGFEEQAANSIHFSYEMVALTPQCCEAIGFPLSEEDRMRPYVEVSGRKGLGVKADDLLDTLERKALAEVKNRHAISEGEAKDIAHSIAVGALRYFLLRFARNTVIAFDFEEALSFEGETGPYVQYAVVRAGNIFRKFEEATGAPAKLASGDVDAGPLGELLDSHDDIWEMICFAARLPEIVEQAVESLEIAMVAKYAFQLAQRFNLFYHKYHILSEADLNRKLSLLLVVDIVRRHLSRALDLLGFAAPPMM